MMNDVVVKYLYLFSIEVGFSQNLKLNNFI